MSDDDVNEAMRAILSRGHCPICARRGFVIGPQGGLAINVECANVECRRRFNVTFFGGDVVTAQQIARRGEGGSIWPSEPHIQ